MSLWDSMRKGVNRAAAEAEKQAAIAKLAMEINTTKGHVNDKLAELGKAALDLYREGKIDDAALEGVVVEITNLESHIKELEDQVATQKGTTEANA